MIVLRANPYQIRKSIKKYQNNNKDGKKEVNFGIIRGLRMCMLNFSHWFGSISSIVPTPFRDVETSIRPKPNYAAGAQGILDRCPMVTSGE